MEDMENYGYTLFRTIPNFISICITSSQEVMHIIIFFAPYHQTTKAVAPKNEPERLDPRELTCFFFEMD